MCRSSPPTWTRHCCCDCRCCCCELVWKTRTKRTRILWPSRRGAASSLGPHLSRRMHFAVCGKLMMTKMMVVLRCARLLQPLLTRGYGQYGEGGGFSVTFLTTPRPKIRHDGGSRLDEECNHDRTDFCYHYRRGADSMGRESRVM